MKHTPTIYIVRHGESLATLDPSLFSRTDPKEIPLTQWGHEQAEEAGKFLKAEIQNNSGDALGKFHIFYTDHLRITQSKDALVDTLGSENIAAQIIDMRLREREHGDFNGLDEAAQKQKNPEIFGKLHAIGKDYARERYETAMPNGESLKDVHQRLNAFIASLEPLLKVGENIVIVTHGGNCKFLEHGLMHHNNVTLFDSITIPRTGDVIKVSFNSSDNASLDTINTVHKGKRRPPTMPKDYKAEPYGLNMQHTY